MEKLFCFKFILLISIASTHSLSLLARNASTDSLKFARPYKHAIHTMPTSLLFLNFNLGYEYVHQQKHGLELSGYYITSGSSPGYKVSLNYKNYRTFHRSYMFWGIFATYSDNHTTTIYESTGYEYTMNVFAVGPNFGMKWAWKSGFCITFRLGYGIPIWNFDWISNHAEDDVYANITELVEKGLAGLDGELKIGWCF